MAKPAENFTASFDSLIASLGLREGEEAYNKCRARFFMDAMEVVNDKVASGDLTAKCLEADYATFVETRGSQNRTPKIEEPSGKGQHQATEDLESKFQVLANAAGCLPGEPRYKRLLRKFLTAVYATNAQKYCSNARNAKDKNKTSSTKIMSQGTNHCPPAVGSSQKSDDESATMTSLRHKLAAVRLDGDVSESASQMPAPEARFQELVLSLGLTKGSKRYKIHRRQFFKYESSRDHILKSGDDIAIEKLERFEESCADHGLQQGSKEFRIFKSHFDIENEDDSETSSDSSFSLCGFTSADDDSQYVLQFKGRLHTTKGNNLHDGKPSDGEVTNSQRSNKKQPKRGRNRAHKDSAQNESSQKDSPPKDGAQKGVAKKGSSQKDRAQRAKEEFKAYFPDPHKLANWQKLCRDLKIDPVPSSITQCKKEVKKIYVNIYQFLHQIKTGVPATRFPNQKELAKYCSRGSKRRFPRELAKDRGALAGLLHYLY